MLIIHFLENGLEFTPSMLQCFLWQNDTKIYNYAHLASNAALNCDDIYLSEAEKQLYIMIYNLFKEG